MPLSYIKHSISALILALVTAPAVARSDPRPAEMCEWAARQAAQESGVPADILGALTLTETGRRLDGVVRPWAWSVNAEGEGSWFDDPTKALAFVTDRIAQGRPNFDVGCFQINFRWHGEQFADVNQMFDPLENARYAARFLQDLYRETGDWRLAAGAFHSRTPQFANRYLARFDTLRSAFRERGFDGMTGTPETYNSFASAASDVGSLGDPFAESQIAQASDPSPRRPRERQLVMLLGAPLGTRSSSRSGSLAVLGGNGGSLWGNAATGPVSILGP